MRKTLRPEVFFFSFFPILGILHCPLLEGGFQYKATRSGAYTPGNNVWNVFLQELWGNVSSDLGICCWNETSNENFNVSLMHFLLVKYWLGSPSLLSMTILNWFLVSLYFLRKFILHLGCELKVLLSNFPPESSLWRSCVTKAILC